MSPDRRDGVYTIAVASRLTGMHAQTLRKYERAGLLRPDRPSGNQRLYSADDIDRLNRIRYLVEVRGLNVAGVEVTLAMSDRLDVPSADATNAELRSAMADASAMSRAADTEPRAPVRNTLIRSSRTRSARSRG